MGVKDRGTGARYTPPMRRAGAVLLVVTISGCASGPGRLTESPVPPDFALEVRDYTPGAGALYIVEPDRWFRAAAGAEPSVQVYPRATRRLTTTQMEAVWNAFASLSVGEGEEQASLIIASTAEGASGRLLLNPANDPQAAELLAQLERLAWLRPAGEESENPRP